MDSASKVWCFGMSYLEMLVLYCLEKLNGERTLYSIYHLLKGKKSSQTIQDAHLYKLTRFFRIFEPVTRESVEAIIQKGLANNWLLSVGEHCYRLTETGSEILKKNLVETPFPNYLNGWKYHSVSLLFWERFSLLVQVISNLNFEEAHYTPIQKNKQAQIWLKAFLKKNKIPKESLGKRLYVELLECLKDTQNIDPSILVYRLTGHHTIGLTPIQIAEILKMDVIKYHVEFQNILHYLIREIMINPYQYEILHSVIVDSKENSTLTHSSKMTFEFIQKGLSIQEIAMQRRLKRSTIEDHIVEIALNIDGFSIDPYIDSNVQVKILEAAEKTETKQLKRIKSYVNEANYFEIRLVLAKYGGGE